jgi:hypothetical protein
MTSVDRPPDPQQDPGSKRWLPVILVPIVTMPFVLGTGALGWLLFGIATAEPDLLWGTVAWAVSAVLLGVGIAAPPGPARRARLVIGVALAVVWFVVGRFVLGP